MDDPFLEHHIIVVSGGPEEATMDYCTSLSAAKLSFQSAVNHCGNSDNDDEFVQWWRLYPDQQGASVVDRWSK